MKAILLLLSMVFALNAHADQSIKGNVTVEKQLNAYNVSAPNKASTSSFSGVQINNTQIGTTGTDNISIRAGATGDKVITLYGDLNPNGSLVYAPSNDSTTTGANATVAGFTTKYIRFTNGLLTSIDMIPAPAGTGTREISLFNNVGHDIVFNLNTGATAANRIIAPTGSTYKLKDGHKVDLAYNYTSLRWVIGSAAGGSAVSDVDIMAVQDFESASLADFTQTGFSLNTATPLHGDVSGLFTHASATTTYSAKQAYVVNPAFRGRNITMQFRSKSNATDGKVKISLGCATDTDILDAESYTLTNVTGGDLVYKTFDMPDSCTSLKVTSAALPEASTPVTEIDDIVFYITKFTAPTSGMIQEADSNLNFQGFAGMGSTRTKVFRYTNVKNNTGSHFSYTQDAVNGLEVVAQKDGYCSIGANIVGDLSANPNIIAIIRDTTDFTGAVNSRVALPEFLGNGNGSSSATSRDSATAFWEGPVKQGQKFYIMGDTAVANIPAALIANFACAGSLKQVSINSNSKITIPTSEVRFEGASSRGSTATAIVKFDTVTKVKGDAFTIVSNSVDGTYVKMNKKGKLNVASSVYQNNASGATYISKNQSNKTIAPAASEQLSTGGSTASVISPVAWEGDVEINDEIRIAALIIPASNASNNATFSFQEQEIQVSVNNVLPQYSESDVVFKGAGNGGQAITANVTDIPFTATGVDTSSSWNGSQYTVKNDGLLTIDAGVTFTAASSRVLGIYINGVVYRYIGARTNDTFFTASLTDTFLKGQVISIRSTGSGTLLNAADTHFINIIQTGKPTVKGVDVTPFVKVNTVKPCTEMSCTQRFEADVSSTGVVSGENFDFINGNFAISTTYNGLFNANAFPKSVPSCVAQVISGGSGSPTRWTSMTSAGANLYITTDAGTVAGTAAWKIICYRTGQDYIDAETAKYDNPSVVAPNQSFSLANNPVYWSATQCLSSQVGCYNTYSYTVNTLTTKAICAARPTQTDADIAVNGFKIHTRVYATAGSCATPTRVELVIGQGMSSMTKTLYKSAGKPKEVGQTQWWYSPTSAQYGFYYSEMNPANGIAVFDSGNVASSSTTISQFLFNDATGATSGYLDISASTSPALSSLNLGVVASSYVGSATAISGTLATIVPTTMKDDTSAIQSAGIWTCRETGRYEYNFGVKVNGTHALNTLSTFQLQLGTAGTYVVDKEQKLYAGGAITSQTSELKGYIRCAKDQTLRLQLSSSATSPTIDSTNGATYFNLIKVKE